MASEEGSASIGLPDQLAIAVLVFSTLAFVVVSVQFVQSIFANAKGLPNCDERVLGGWANRSGLRFWHVWRYLRAEVEFESPILFVALKSNQRGPLRPKQTKIFYADGKVASQKDYRIDLAKEIVYDQQDLPSNQAAASTAQNPKPADVGTQTGVFRRLWPRRTSGVASNPNHVENGVTDNQELSTLNGAVFEPPKRKPRERIATVAHERITWLALLIAIQRMERDSAEWDAAKWGSAGLQQPQVEDKKKLAVAMQVLRRSFATNPSVKKPYATSNICHVVELAAMLGVYWKEFDRENDRYRAAGNGYILSGRALHDFGIVFTFEQTGWPSFGKSRTIHASEIKEMCFGNVPTIYRRKEDDVDWEIPFAGEQGPGRGIQTLQLGSRREIANTLSNIGCNANTTAYYLEDQHRHTHLFPVVFEVLGMLARTIHIKERCYTYLPNPTIFTWNCSSDSKRRLLKAFSSQINALEGYGSSENLKRIKTRATKLVRELSELHHNEDDYSPGQLKELHDALDCTDLILDSDTVDVTTVQDVLRRHIQEVLEAINTSRDEATAFTPMNLLRRAGTSNLEDHQANEDVQARIDRFTRAMSTFLADISGSQMRPPTRTATVTTSSTGNESILEGEISFDDLFTIPPEGKEDKLMEMYFILIRPRAISVNRQHHHRSAAERSLEIQAESPRESTRREGKSPRIGSDKEASLLLDSDYNDIWCTLVFRMICWLLLHNFDKMDRQIPKSELIGSRLPVYFM